MRDFLKYRDVLWLLPALCFMAFGGAALADKPRPWEMTWQEPATPTMERIIAFHDLMFWIIVVITLFVMVLLLIIMVRFNEKANPTPSKTTHNAVLEVLWTAIPVVILVVVAIPSLRLLYFMDTTDKADMTLKIVGHQWFWSYEYPDHGNFTFDSLMIPDDQIKPGQTRLLEVDNRVVLPIDTNIRLLMTSVDVIHSWALPSLIHKLDTVPGRINETWMRITKEGVYYGQCSELCGINHGFMPIAVEAVSKERFAAWTAEAQKKFAKVDGGPADAAPINVAQAAERR